MFSAELRFYQRVYVVKNMICDVANDYGFRRLRKILYVDKRDFNFDSCSVLKKLEATVFHDC